MMIRRIRVLLVVAFVAGGAALFGAPVQQMVSPPAATAPLSAKIPVDPQITLGRLPNGLTYYVRANKEPQNRAELRLVVNAGSVLEDDDQRGLAHMVEHLAFDGTAHFPNEQVIDFLQSLGMQFGQDVNAYTSYDETVYMLEVPTDKPEMLDRALLILEDWAHNVTMDPTEIDKERGVVTEEWRLGRGAAVRIQDQQFPVIFKGSRYADRIPIGLMDIVQHAPYARVKQFYTDWYRPDLMAVIAVGDFDRSAVEGLIKTHFTGIPEPAHARPRPSFPVPPHAETLYALATDKELARTDVSVDSLSPARDQTTIGAYRQQEILEGLYSSMLSARLTEIAQKPDAPFLRASVDRGLVVRTAEDTSLSAVVRPDSIDRGLQALFTESARVTQFGFTETELQRRKATIQRNLEIAVEQRDKRNSASFADELGRNFLEHEPIPGIEYENELYQRFLPEITLADVNALAKTWLSDHNRVVEVSAPDKPGITLPTQAALAADMKGTPGVALAAYTDTVDAAPLVDHPPAGGSIVSTTSNEAYRTTEWTLSNGAKVILKPTTFKEDELLMDAFAMGGDSLASDQDFLSAERAAQIISAGGLGRFNAIDLRKALAGKAASVRPSIGEVDESISGSSSAKDLETFFQLVYLTFTAPRADRDAFNVMTANLRTQLANQEAEPGFAFSSALASALSQDHPRARLMTPAMVDQLNLDTALTFYKDRFADASGFTFVFVGTIDLATMRPLVERYLASLPATHANNTFKDVGIRPPTSVVERTVTKGIDPKSETAIVFTGPFEYDQVHRATIRAMSMVLENRLREALREDMGGTYSQSASPSYAKLPIPEYHVTVTFGSSPERADALATRAFQEIDRLKTDGPTAQEVDNVKLALEREYETSSRENRFFVGEIAARLENGEDLRDLFALPTIYNAISGQSIQDAAREYLDAHRYVKVTLLPAPKDPPPSPGAKEADGAGVPNTKNQYLPGRARASVAPPTDPYGAP